MESHQSHDRITELLDRGVVNVIPGRAALAAALQSGQTLNVYLGVDPTASRIHLGHAVNLRTLQRFVELGHRVTFLIGDFTTRIGDNSDKESERPILSEDEIEKNFQTYKEQASKFLDSSRVTVRYNSEWLSKLSFGDVVRLCQQFTLNDYIGREIMKKKLEQGTSIRLDELFYPIMQGYDSYVMDTDVQIGAADQTFNMQAGRVLQKRLRGKESHILVNDYLPGTDGRKMSKSWGNAVWLTDSPDDVFGKVMSLRDDLIKTYFVLGTNAPTATIEQVEQRLASGENPMVLKKELAEAVVVELHGKEKASEARGNFEIIFQKKTLSDAGIPEVAMDQDRWEPVELIMALGFAKSKSEAKRFLQYGEILYFPGGTGTGMRLESWSIGTNGPNRQGFGVVRSNDVVQHGRKKIRLIVDGT
jgi:tyrosyl-tRNA synthetase